MSNPQHIAALLPQAVESLRKYFAPDCRRCGVQMKPGIALEDILSGTPEWPGDSVYTVSASGRARQIPCWKCPACGHSVAMES